MSGVLMFFSTADLTDNVADITGLTFTLLTASAGSLVSTHRLRSVFCSTAIEVTQENHRKTRYTICHSACTEFRRQNSIETYH